MPAGESLRCSFCRKSQQRVENLISSPSEYPRAYICDECIATCWAILDDDRADEENVDSPADPHPLLDHPLASELMECIVDWIRQESLGQDVSEPLARVRSLAARLVADLPE